MGVITYETQKLRERYANFLETREEPIQLPATPAIATSQVTTDDERIVLYYILKKNVRKVSKGMITNWLLKSEIYDVNVDNAFDLLASLDGVAYFDGEAVVNDTLEFGIATFREYSANSTTMLPELGECVNRHTKIAADTFKALWTSNTWNPMMGLFVAYIVDEGMYLFGSRWMAEAQIEDIKQWESKHSLDSMLSNNYGKCLEVFIQNDLVYESNWTSYGNPKEYTLCPSLQKFLLNCPLEFAETLKKIKDAHYCEIPF